MLAFAGPESSDFSSPKEFQAEDEQALTGQKGWDRSQEIVLWSATASVSLFSPALSCRVEEEGMAAGAAGSFWGRLHLEKRKT